ncbi:hypothetical protein HDU97_001960 [Phlyctochytrium planicorne]|nr:hypothetical protein HDU97_001960 [Phlyctochytrium planicorne]
MEDFEAEGSQGSRQSHLHDQYQCHDPLNQLHSVRSPYFSSARHQQNDNEFESAPPNSPIRSPNAPMLPERSASSTLASSSSSVSALAKKRPLENGEASSSGSSQKRQHSDDAAPVSDMDMENGMINESGYVSEPLFSDDDDDDVSVNDSVNGDFAKLPGSPPRQTFTQISSSPVRQCPICAKNLSTFDGPASEAHVNKCLDSPDFAMASALDEPNAYQEQKRAVVNSWANLFSKGKSFSASSNPSASSKNSPRVNRPNLKRSASSTPTQKSSHSKRGSPTSSTSSLKRNDSKNTVTASVSKQEPSQDKYYNSAPSTATPTIKSESTKETDLKNPDVDSASDFELDSSSQSKPQLEKPEARAELDAIEEIYCEDASASLEIFQSFEPRPQILNDANEMDDDTKTIIWQGSTEEEGFMNPDDDDGVEMELRDGDPYDDNEGMGEFNDAGTVGASLEGVEDSPNLDAPEEAGPVDDQIYNFSEDDEDFASLDLSMLQPNSISMLLPNTPADGASTKPAVKGKKGRRKRGGKQKKEPTQETEEKKKKPVPFYKWIPKTKITVDAFCYGKIDGCEAYFLSHFHSDHYGGLTSKFSHGPIYCSGVTGALVRHQLRVNEDWIYQLPLDTEVEIFDGIKVTLVDANHCPGAVLFIFQIPDSSSPGKYRKFLHTGDFRAHSKHLAPPNPVSLVPKYDAVFLDTTYMNPQYCFPAQEDVIEAIRSLCKGVCLDGKTIDEMVGSVSAGKGKGLLAWTGIGSAVNLMSNWLQGKKATPNAIQMKLNVQAMTPKRKGTLVVVGSYLIGKEKVFKAIAKSLNTKIFAQPYKRKVLELLDDAELFGMLTKDANEAGVFVTDMGKLNEEHLKGMLDQHRNRFNHVIGVRPTGWTFRPSAATTQSSYTIRSLRPNHISREVTVIGLPYSEHSSYLELKRFVQSVPANKIIPTVNMSKVAQMQGVFEEWRREKVERDGRFGLVGKNGGSGAGDLKPNWKEKVETGSQAFGTQGGSLEFVAGLGDYWPEEALRREGDVIPANAFDEDEEEEEEPLLKTRKM